MAYKLLTRQEELLLLAIWKLQENAYGMAIKEQVQIITGSKWSFGAVYAPLSRLLKKELVLSEKGEPTHVRGGKSKVFYTLTKDGINALINIKKVHESSWEDIPALEYRK